VITSDPQNPIATSFLVRNGRFVYVGNVSAASNATNEPPAKLVDLQGAFVTPGLIDSHVHLLSAGLSLRHLDLRSVCSKEEFVEVVETAAQHASPGDWILGSHWDEGLWGGLAPRAQWIDEFTSQNPVFLTRVDSHQGLANSKAMKMSGIIHGHGVTDVSVLGGEIHRDAVDGSPTGLLSGSAMSLVMERIPSPTIPQLEVALVEAQEQALRCGVTSVHDMGRVEAIEGEDAAWNDLLQIYLPAAADGTLRLRVRAFLPLPTWKRAADLIKAHGSQHPGGRLSWGGVMYDESPGSHTAFMHEDFDDVFKNVPSIVDSEEFRRNLWLAHNAGLQVAVHAIRHRDVGNILDSFAALDREDTKGPHRTAAGGGGGEKNQVDNGAAGGVAAHRHRIELAQYVSGKGDAKRMVELGVIAIPNPLYLPSGERVLDNRPGVSREKWATAFSALHTAGVRCAYASDWPMAPLDPLSALFIASSPTTSGPKVSPGDLLASVSTVAAFAGFQEQSVGAIREGLRADFVIFDSDVLKSVASSNLIPRPRVLKTFVEGKCEYGCSETVIQDWRNGENRGRGEL